MRGRTTVTLHAVGLQNGEHLLLECHGGRRRTCGCALSRQRVRGGEHDSNQDPTGELEMPRIDLILHFASLLYTHIPKMQHLRSANMPQFGTDWEPQARRPTSRRVSHDCPRAFGHHLPPISQGRGERDISAVPTSATTAASDQIIRKSSGS